MKEADALLVCFVECSLSLHIARPFGICNTLHRLLGVLEDATNALSSNVENQASGQRRISQKRPALDNIFRVEILSVWVLRKFKRARDVPKIVILELDVAVQHVGKMVFTLLLPCFVGGSSK